MDCLKGIIGITRTPCECLQPYLPDDYMESKSGLYIDELPESPINLKSINNISECGNDFPTLLEKARENAVKVFKLEIFKHLQSKYRTKVKPYTGTVGSTTFRSNMTDVDPNKYAGVALTMRNVQGASITVDKVYTAFTGSTALNLLVYKGYQGDSSERQLINRVEVETKQNALYENKLTNPIYLPTSDETGRVIEYYFLYEMSDNQPKDNLVSCNCGNKEVELRNYFTHKGVVGEEGSPLTSYERTNFVNGIVLNVVAGCDAEQTICEAYETNEYIRTVIQWSILRKAVEILIISMLKSRTINRDTMADREQMQHTAWGLEKKFNNDVQWIAEEIDMTGNDCFICDRKDELYYKSGILT